ncbi:MAG: hypothetical protein EA358_06805 [Flavobacteriales bacterium]|nr:MAG: hypothetical protein EA358_06805 [Flavobacteriales bacterium]
MVMSNEHLSIAQLQQQIESYLQLGSTNVIFNYQDKGGEKLRLDVITVNPRHEQSFLFHSEYGFDKIDALRKVLDYVQNYRSRDNSYTIQWSVRGENELHTSYFRARDIVEAIEKLHYGRDANSLVIFSVVLNPIS